MSQIYEPKGGNLYRPHALMASHATFWRCKHGRTGYGENMIWEGCIECAEADPQAYKTWKGECESLGLVTSETKIRAEDAKIALRNLTSSLTSMTGIERRHAIDVLERFISQHDTRGVLDISDLLREALAHRGYYTGGGPTDLAQRLVRMARDDSRIIKDDARIIGEQGAELKAKRHLLVESKQTVKEASEVVAATQELLAKREKPEYKISEPDLALLKDAYYALVLARNYLPSKNSRVEQVMDQIDTRLAAEVVLPKAGDKAGWRISHDSGRTWQYSDREPAVPKNAPGSIIVKKLVYAPDEK